MMTTACQNTIVFNQINNVRMCQLNFDALLKKNPLNIKQSDIPPLYKIVIHKQNVFPVGKEVVSFLFFVHFYLSFKYSLLLHKIFFIQGSMYGGKSHCACIFFVQLAPFLEDTFSVRCMTFLNLSY